MKRVVKVREDDPIARDLKTVADHFLKEDNATREIQIRYWKRLKYYWNNFSQIFWSEREGHYLGNGIFGSAGSTTDQAYYDRPVNVFKAFLETIIAALSVNIPSVNCIPDDADNPLDISTAKAGNMISKQIYRHNDMIMIWLQALYIYCTEGLIACYTYKHESEEYGTYQKEKYKEEEIDGYACPSCGIELDEEMLVAARIYKDDLESKFNPDESDVDLENMQDEELPGNTPIEPIVCPGCSVELDPDLQKSKLTIKRFDGHTTHPKSRLCMEIYGGLYVKVANYAKKQRDTYLIWMYETHYTNALEAYPELIDHLPQGGWSNQGVNDNYEQYARLNVQYRGTYPEENVTVRNTWLRPQHFYILPQDDCDRLRKKFPNGAKIVIVNDTIAEYCAEDLDDHWTLTENPLSDYLSHEPLGEVLTNIQDIVNDLISLTLQTIEHGVSQTWVDPAVVDTNAYGQTEISPGALTPTKPVDSSRRIADAFHNSTTAALSPDTLNFYQIINQLGQFVSGALPSLFGGVQQGAGDTASEYAMSKSMALQRLQTPWKMLTVWFKKIMAKAIPQYMEMMVDDERVVEKDEQGNYINVFIRKAELAGKIGDIELEGGDQLPVSEEQQRDIIMQLMNLNNQEVFTALVAPENLSMIRKIVRIPEFRMPGEESRNKQYEEITELLNGVPIPVPISPEMMFASRVSGEELGPTELPSVEIDPIVDNHVIEADICKNWLNSEAGRLAKKENQQGYLNVLLHFKQHVDEINKQQMMIASANAMTSDSEEGSEKQTPAPKGQKQKGPEMIKGE